MGSASNCVMKISLNCGAILLFHSIALLLRQELFQLLMRRRDEADRRHYQENGTGATEPVSGDRVRQLDKSFLLQFTEIGFRRGFLEMDVDENGRLDTAELMQGLEHLDLSEKNRAMLLKSIDLNEDKFIGENEYILFQLSYWLYRRRLLSAAKHLKYVEAADCWEDLIEYSRGNCAHFNYFWCKVRVHAH